MSPLFSDWLATLRESAQARRRPYRTYRETWQRVFAAAGGCERASITTGGASHLGEPLWIASVDPPRPPQATVFVLAGLHAMEHVGVAAAVALFERATRDDSPWDRHRLVVMPMVNPDGFLAVQNTLARGQRRFRRKNARGVDLNRNFAVSWDRDYYLNRLLKRVFSPGAGPLSEPETRAVDRLLAVERPAVAVSLHAFGEWIFLPFAGSRERPPQLGRMREIANAMAEKQPLRGYRIAQLATRSRLFRACGAEIDHFYARHGALSFLFEIGSGPGLATPGRWFDPYAWFTPPPSTLERDVDNVVPALEVLAGLELEGLPLHAEVTDQRGYHDQSDDAK